jgi:hypothetical protein
VNDKERQMERAPIISNAWIGQDGRRYRSIKYWVGAGYTAGFLQVEDDLLNWFNI